MTYLQRYLVRLNPVSWRQKRPTAAVAACVLVIGLLFILGAVEAAWR